MAYQKHNYLFKLSILSASILSGLACAADGKTDETQQLDTVYVSGQMVTAKPVENWRALQRDTATDLKEVLQDQVAVNFGGGNGVSQWVTIRGMGQDQIDFVVDDTATTSQIFHHQGRFMMDPALMKVVGIEKGTGSASSGIGATSGKIEATTVDAADLLLDGKNVGARVNGGVSNNDGYNGGIAAYGRGGGFDGIVITNWVRDNNYKDGHGNEVGNSALGNRSLLAKGAYNFNENNRLVLSHRREEQYGMRNLREEFFFDTANDNPTYRHRTVDTTNLAYHGRKLGALGSVDANIYRIDSEQKSNGAVTTIEASGANLRFSTPLPNTRHLVKYGLNWRTEKGTPASLSAGLQSQEKEDIGLYVEGIWSWHPITLTTGLRYDKFEFTNTRGGTLSDDAVNPSVGIIWDATEHLSFNASYNVATRSPRLYEVMLSNVDIRFGNNVKAERSRNAEIGFSWDYGGFSLEGAYFQQTIKDLQSFVGQNCRGRSCAYYNIVSSGELKNKGYELNAAYRWKGLVARAGVAESEPELNGTTADAIVTAVPMGRQWMTGLSYQFDNPRLQIGWRGRYAEKASYMSAAALRGGGAATERSGYGVHDIYLNWQPTGKDTFNINFSVNNVGDKYYRSHSQRAGTNALPEPGREFRLSANYRF